MASAACRPPPAAPAPPRWDARPARTAQPLAVPRELARPGTHLGHRVALAPGAVVASAPGAAAVLIWPTPTDPGALAPGAAVPWTGPAQSGLGTALAAAPDGRLLLSGTDPDSGAALLWLDTPAPAPRPRPLAAPAALPGPGAGADAVALGGGWALGLPKSAGADGAVLLLDAAGQPTHRIAGRAHALAGATVASPGDLDGDGHPELVIGGWAWSGHRGQAALFFGPIAADQTLDDADHHIAGLAAWDMAGWSLAGTDLDGDGHSDLAVGAFGADQPQLSTGMVSIWPGPTGQTSSGSLLGPIGGAQAGFALAALGPGALAVGGPGMDGGAGLVWLWSGPVDGVQTLDRATGRVLPPAGARGLGTRLAARSDPPLLALGLPDSGEEAGAVLVALP